MARISSFGMRAMSFQVHSRRQTRIKLIVPMNFSPVTYTGLSSLTHQILLSEHDRFSTPKFKIIKFVGTYAIGFAGAPDARYIRAACEAAHAAWYTEANILDFTELDYQWGDEMEGIFTFGWDRVQKIQRPLAVLVGERCRTALQSLPRDEYQDYCRDNLDDALVLAEQKLTHYKEHQAKEHQEFLKRWNNREKS